MIGALHPEQFFIVIPCHNCSAYLGHCLRSLQAQTFTGWKALVADDASDDDTAETVASFLADERISYRRLPERAWLMGNTLDALRSLNLRPNDVVAVLDGDDRIYPQCLEKLWDAHCRGYDLVYTDEDIQGQGYSIGADLIPGVPVRRQTWRFSQLRSFKGYLFSLLDDDVFRDRTGRYFRAAGDLSLYLPMAELAGYEKVHFISERLYFYRIHDRCNFRAMRQEQLDNNWFIRSRTPLERQTRFFDHTVVVTDLEKPGILEVAAQIRREYPDPMSVCIQHRIRPEDRDAWRAYHGLWVKRGVFFDGVIAGGGKNSRE